MATKPKRRKIQPPTSSAEIEAGAQALTDFTRLVSTKRDLNGAVIAVLEAARKVRASQ